MGKWVLYTQPNYEHPKPTQTRPFATPKLKQAATSSCKPNCLQV